MARWLAGRRGRRGAVLAGQVMPVAETLPGADADVAGVIRWIRIGQWARGAMAEFRLADPTGSVTLRFTGPVPNLAPGDRVRAAGPATWRGGVVIENPVVTSVR